MNEPLVQLMHYTPVRNAVYAGLVCTDNEDNIDKYDTEEFLLRLIRHGHLSVLEHVSYTFIIDRISRALLQELARHRLVSLSVQSTRWALKKILKEVPAPILDPNLLSIVKYNLTDVYMNSIKYITHLIDAGVPIDSVKYVLPECLPTKLVLTVNARELRHIFELRTSERALWEFQRLCHVLYEQLPDTHKFLYKDVIRSEDNS